jgi:hypothetical protein
MSSPLARLRSRHRGQLVCSCCGAPVLCPIDWDPVDDEHWHIEARCGACGVWHGALHRPVHEGDVVAKEGP